MAMNENENENENACLQSNQSLRKLSLEINEIGDEGCKALAEALKVSKT